MEQTRSLSLSLSLSLSRCDINIETTSHFFLHCPLFHAKWSSLLKNIKQKCVSRDSFKDEVNLLILSPTIYFFLSTHRFGEPLYLLWIHGCFFFYSWLYGKHFTVFKILLCMFSYYLFCIPGTHNSHGARWLLFLCLLCKCSFP